MEKMKITIAIEKILYEHANAVQKFKPFNSAHEGFAVIQEEIDELWEEVKRKQHHIAAMEKEAVQCGAMILRFLTEVVDS